MRTRNEDLDAHIHSSFCEKPERRDVYRIRLDREPGRYNDRWRGDHHWPKRAEHNFREGQRRAGGLACPHADPDEESSRFEHFAIVPNRKIGRNVCNFRRKIPRADDGTFSGPLTTLNSFVRLLAPRLVIALGICFAIIARRGARSLVTSRCSHGVVLSCGISDPGTPDTYVKRLNSHRGRFEWRSRYCRCVKRYLDGTGSSVMLDAA